MRLFAIAVVAMLAWIPAAASVVDATKAERAYLNGDYKDALALFFDASEAFRVAPKDSADPAIYREAAYLYDRMADCSFTQRDWNGLKHYMDGLLVVSVSERNLCETRLASAMESEMAMASAKVLAQQLDEAVQLSTIYQYKRSIALVLYDTNATGDKAQRAIKLFQQLASAVRGVIEESGGRYVIDQATLSDHEQQLREVFDGIEALTDLDALWDKYQPGGDSISNDSNTG